MMPSRHARNRADDLLLPTLLFAALGGMTWAVRGCSGFGAMNGCVFAGVTWGAAWWFISRDPANRQSRPYTSGWIILALTFGIGLSGNRGWMQWPSFFVGHLQTNTPEGRFQPIPRFYGFIWLFIAGVPWAGLGACLLAWCGTHRPTRLIDWTGRVAGGIAGALIARALFNAWPDVFLPLHSSLAAQYADTVANPNLRRLINDNRNAVLHLGIYLGFLGYEVVRRDWRNTTLILTVGLVNGTGWALCQNWSWAPGIWPQAGFNWWRCWESSGGISIGIAYGLAYYLVNRPEAGATPETRNFDSDPKPNLERLGAYAGLICGLGLSIKNGLKGWANIYVGHEDEWDRLLWRIIAPLIVLGIVICAFLIRRRPLAATFAGDRFPRAYRMIWMALITQNVIAQLITGPHSSWNETAFSIYYLLLFFVTAVIVHYYHCSKTAAASGSFETGGGPGSPPLRG
jgi:hypothetical protein